jgi:hypothetical protein
VHIRSLEDLSDHQRSTLHMFLVCAFYIFVHGRSDQEMPLHDISRSWFLVRRSPTHKALSAAILLLVRFENTSTASPRGLKSLILFSVTQKYMPCGDQNLYEIPVFYTAAMERTDSVSSTGRRHSRPAMVSIIDREESCPCPRFMLPLMIWRTTKVFLSMFCSISILI